MNGKENGLLIKADLDRDFFSMKNHGIRNNQLSFKAKGLLTFMFQTPPGWEFTISGLSACATDGESSISSGLKELSDKWYFKRLTFRKHGRFAYTRYLISDIPVPKDYIQKKYGEQFKISPTKAGFILNERQEFEINTETRFSSSSFSDISFSGSEKSGQLNINELSIELSNYLFNKHSLNFEKQKELSEDELKAYQIEFEKEKGCAEKEKENLPPEELKINKAIESIWSYLNNWPDMIKAMKKRAKITPEVEERTGFDLNNEIESFVRRNSHNVQFMYNPNKYITGGHTSLQSWLNRFIQFNSSKNNNTVNNGKSERENTSDFQSRVLSGLLSKGE